MDNKRNLGHEAWDGILDEVTPLDVISGIVLGLSCGLIISVTFIQHRADRRATVKLLKGGK